VNIELKKCEMMNAIWDCGVFLNICLSRCFRHLTIMTLYSMIYILRLDELMSECTYPKYLLLTPYEWNSVEMVDVSHNLIWSPYYKSFTNWLIISFFINLAILINYSSSYSPLFILSNPLLIVGFNFNIFLPSFYFNIIYNFYTLY